MTDLAILPEWPDQIACPYFPLKREGAWLVFQQRVAERGHAPKRVYLSDYQLRHGQLDDLQFRHDWLAEHFPFERPEDGDTLFEPYDPRAVAAWLTRHIDRVNAAYWRARRGDRAAAPAAVPGSVVVHPTGRSGTANGTLPTITALAATRQADGSVRLNATVLPARDGDRIASAGFLTAEQAAELARTLTGGTF